jgi:ABC-type transport system substrate-binding protein
VYQSLVTVDGNAMASTGAVNVVPMLAQNWTVSSDGRTYTFNLRPGINFSSGNPLTSYSIWAQMYGLYYISVNNSFWWLDYPVFNMSTADFGPATLALLNQSGVINPSSQLMAIMTNTSWPIYVNGPDQIIFHLQAPFAYFPGTMVVFQGLIFDTQWLLQHGGFGPPGVYNSYFNNNPIPGTGPYVVSSVSVNSYVQFTKNPSYWGDSLNATQLAADEYADPGHVQNVIVQVKSDDFARYTDLQGSSATNPVISTILDQNWPNVIGNPSTYAYSTVPQKSMLIVGAALNVLRYPTNITAVRNAMYYAVNYSDIDQTAYNGNLYPWVGPEYPSWTQFYDLTNSTPWPTNVSLAKSILASACAANSNACPQNFPPMQFAVLTGCTFCLNTATIIKQDLANIGITVNVDVLGSANYVCATAGTTGVAGPCSFAQSAKYAQNDTNIVWLGTYTFAPGADTPGDPWLGWVSGSTPANNWAVYSNPIVQKCDNEFVSVVSATQLKADCTAAQAQINNDTPYIWIGSLKLVQGSGSMVWNKNQISSSLIDPVYSGQSDTVVFNTVQFTNGQM